MQLPHILDTTRTDQWATLCGQAHTALFATPRFVERRNIPVCPRCAVLLADRDEVAA